MRSGAVLSGPRQFSSTPAEGERGMGIPGAIASLAVKMRAAWAAGPRGPARARPGASAAALPPRPWPGPPGLVGRRPAVSG